MITNTVKTCIKAVIYFFFCTLPAMKLISGENLNIIKDKLGYYSDNYIMYWQEKILNKRENFGRG